MARRRERIDRLADEIAICAARIDVATHELLTMVREFDESGGWALQGADSCAHWLSWRIGCGLNAAGEKVRTARALATLPKIDGAFAEGRLSYSKVRAMTRVATASNEELLLQYAQSSTGSQLEKICRGLRSFERREAKKQAPPVRYAKKRQRDDGMVRISLVLHPDEAELFWDALHQTKRSLAGEDLSAESAKPTLADAAVAMAEQRLAAAPDEEARPAARRRQLVVHLRESKLDEGRLRAELHDGTLLSGETLLRLACDGSLVPVATDDDGEVTRVGRKRRKPSARMMTALRSRDRHCVFPGCTCAAFLEAHHIEHWAQGGETTKKNLALLCWRHHQLLHEGGFAMKREPDGLLTFFDPQGRRIEPLPKRPTPTERLADVQEHKGIHIDRTTSLPNWYGQSLDFIGTVNALVRKKETSSAAAPQGGGAAP